VIDGVAGRWKKPSGLSSDGNGQEREGVVGERGVLEEGVEDVEAQAVDALASQWRTTSSMASFTSGLR
jgi:hypothetical protein